MPIHWPIVPQIPGGAAGTRSGVTFLGKGLRSPLREDPATGDFQTVADEENVSQCLRDGILTNLGERVMSEGLGTITRDLLFEQARAVADLVPPSVRSYVETWESRVIFISCTCEEIASSSESVQFEVTLRYKIRATNTTRNLVFPFYLNSEG